MFLIGESGAAADESEDSEVAAPFAVELGDATGYAGGFAVTALRSLDAGRGALVALVGPDASHGQLVDLGALSGRGEPPRIASSGDRILVVVPDDDARGRKLRLASIHGSAPRADVRRGVELAQSEGDSQRFGLALGGSHGVLVWDEYDPSRGRGTVRVSSFDLDDISTSTPAQTASPAQSNVEGVQVVRRPGGYWVAWISHSSYSLPDAGADAALAKRVAVPAPSSDDGALEFDSVVDLGPRWLEVVPLGEDGARTAEPSVVTGEEAHVLAFDLTAGPDGSAWLAWRDDRTSPGAEKRSVHLARVRPDGGRDTQEVRDEELGAGAPSLLVDSSPSGQGPGGWLALESVQDVMRIAALDTRLSLQDELAPEPVIRGAEPVALRAGALLLARPRGTGVELSVVTCRVGRQLPVEDGVPPAELPPEAPPISPPPTSR